MGALKPAAGDDESFARTELAPPQHSSDCMLLETGGLQRLAVVWPSTVACA